MEVFETVLPVITTILGAALSLLGLEIRNVRNKKANAKDARLASTEAARKKVAEMMLLAVATHITTQDAKREIIKVYAANFDLLPEGFLTSALDCFSENDTVSSERVNLWIENYRV